MGLYISTSSKSKKLMQKQMGKAYYANRGLFIGIASLIFGFYFFAPTLFTFKSSLVEQSGEVEYLEIIYTQVEDSKGRRSIKSELKFTLNSTQSLYVLMKNIGYSRHNERFEKLKRLLKRSEKASVWIKKSQKENYEPTVFQISDRNGKILYDFEESKSHSRLGFLISFGLGILGIGIFVHYKYSNQIKNR